MDRKIIAVMVTLVVVAALVVAFVMIAAGGMRGNAGGFTDLFDDLQNPEGETHDQQLALPSNWAVNEVKTVSDVIVDLTYYEQTVAQTKVYVTTLYFAYMGEKWTNPVEGGANFYVPDDSFDGWLEVDHGLFHITVSSATNLSEDFHPGEVIELKVSLVSNDANQQLAFGVWTVADTI
jgi:hypothetical protein